LLQSLCIDFKRRSAGNAELRAKEEWLMKNARLYVFISCVMFGVTNTTLGEFGTNVFTSATAVVNPNAPVPVTETIIDRDDCTLEDCSASGGAQAMDGGASANVSPVATARIGDLGVLAIAFAGGNDPIFGGAGGFATGHGQAIAEWQDTSVVIAPGKPIGRQLIAKTRLFITGSITAAATSSPNFKPPVGPTIPASSGQALGVLKIFDSATPRALPPAPTTPSPVANTWAFRQLIPLAGINHDFPVPGTIDMLMRMTNGQPNTIGFELELDVDVSALSRDMATIEGIFGGSLHWGGIQGVEDAETGEAIDDWTITSESGFDYSQPFGVPEPSSIALLSFALCLWQGRARTRRLRSWATSLTPAGSRLPAGYSSCLAATGLPTHR
jgi:hypothetical protein